MRPAGGAPPSAAPSTRGASPLVELGRIVGRHGIRGEVRLLPHNPDSSAVMQAGEVVLIRADEATEPRRVRAARRHKRVVLLQLDGVATADEADALVGCRIAVPRASLPPPGPEAVYHADLIGCRVRTTAGAALGSVRELIVTGSNDVCVVDGGGREYLIPLIADVIATLDPAAKLIVVRPVPGLLDA